MTPKEIEILEFMDRKIQESMRNSVKAINEEFRASLEKGWLEWYPEDPAFAKHMAQCHYDILAGKTKQP